MQFIVIIRTVVIALAFAVAMGVHPASPDFLSMRAAGNALPTHAV